MWGKIGKRKYIVLKLSFFAEKQICNNRSTSFRPREDLPQYARIVIEYDLVQGFLFPLPGTSERISD